MNDQIHCSTVVLDCEQTGTLPQESLDTRNICLILIWKCTKMILACKGNRLKIRLSPSKKVAFICFTEGLLTMTISTFYVNLKGLFVLNIFNFCPDFFGSIGQRFNKKAVYFDIYDVINWKTNNYNKQFGQFIKIITWEIFFFKGRE